MPLWQATSVQNSKKFTVTFANGLDQGMAWIGSILANFFLSIENFRILKILFDGPDVYFLHNLKYCALEHRLILGWSWKKQFGDKMSGLIWIQTVWHADDIPERIFLKNWFWKNQQMQKSMQNYPVGRDKNDIDVQSSMSVSSNSIARFLIFSIKNR